MAKDNILVDQKLALSLFLDALLHEPAPESVVAPERVTTLPEQTPPSLAVLRPVRVPPQQLPPVALPEPALKTPLTPPVVSLPRSGAPALATPDAATEVLRPDWATEAFQILLFKVAGLGLAVPLIELNGIVEWTDAVTPLPGHADFYLGLLQHRDCSVPVVDPARLVLPAQQFAALTQDPRERVRRIVLIDEGRWGLACDQVSEVITVKPEQVRWRGRRTQRRWLAGTVIDHMCALLDTQAFARLLESGWG